MSVNKKRAGSNTSVSNLEDVWTGPCKILLLPLNIIIDILSRLPIKTILSCKRVCRGWLRLIFHPRFVQLQLSRSSSTILIKTIPSVNHSRKITLTHVHQRGRAPFRFDRLVLTPKSNLPTSNSKFGIVNSCNGLLCLSAHSDIRKEDPIWVCNPILGEFVTLPSASKGRQWGSFVGLGFCSLTNRYKVLQTFYPKVECLGNHFLDAEIYCMDTGTWRSIKCAPGDPVASPFNSQLHDSLHWVPIVSKSAEFIYSFNFRTEEFGSVPPPPCLYETHREFSEYLTVGVMEGCLFLCVFGNDSTRFDLWVMKDYGVQESWTKHIVIENLYPRQMSPDLYEPIKFLENGEILMFFNRCEVTSYNPLTKTFRSTKLTRTRNPFVSIAHTPSLISLYHVAKGDLVQRVQGSKEEHAKSSVEPTADYTNFATLPDMPPTFNYSTPHHVHPGATFEFQDFDQRTGSMSAANAEYFAHITGQGFPTPHMNDVSANLASTDTHPFLWHL